MRRLRSIALVVIMLAIGAALVGWNLSRFIGSTAKIREKDISFLPSPVVAELLCLGHRNTAAKLRWIDSFAYFEYQLDHKDDHVMGGGREGGFDRLYDTLITLDPKFQPFYEHASLNTAGLLGQEGISLKFMMRGMSNLPDSSLMRRNVATILRVFFHWQEKLPQAFGMLLSEWRSAVPQDADQITIWMISIGRQVSNAGEQANFWLEQLHATKEGTPAGDFIDQKVRVAFADLGVSSLETLLRAYRISHGAQPTSVFDLWQDSDLIDPMRMGRPAVAETEPRRLEDLISPRLLRGRYTKDNFAYGPITVVAGQLQLRTDPFGLPWRLESGKIVSTGLERLVYGVRIARANDALLASARERGHWAASLDEVAALGIQLPEPPMGGHLALVGEALEVHWDRPSAQPWTLH